MGKTNFEKIADMLGVEMNKDFKIKGYTFYHRLTNCGLTSNNGRHMMHKPNTLYDLLRGVLEIDRWPEDGDKYFFPSFEYGGANIHAWANDKVDNKIRQVVGIYRTKEEAQAKARELGWIEEDNDGN